MAYNFMPQFIVELLSCGLGKILGLFDGEFSFYAKSFHVGFRILQS